MVSFENFVKSMPPSLSELKVTPNFCFPFKIPDDPTATIIYISWLITFITFLFEGLDLNKCDHLTRRQLERFARKEADVYYYLSYVRILHTEENG